MSKAFQRHPLSGAFPPMSPEAFEELKADINENGVREKIVVFEDMILDGWHRYSACMELNVKKPPIVEYEGDDPIAYVLSKNFHRRHMDKSQRAFSVAKLFEWQEGAGRPASKSLDAANKFSASKELTREAAADLAGVGVSTIDSAKEATKAEQSVQDAVVAGEMSVKEAARLAKKPAKEQNEAVEAKKSGAKPAKPRKEKEETVPLSEFTKMEDQYNELANNYESMALQLKAYSSVANDTAVEEIRVLQAQVITLTQSRDEWQNKCNEMSKQIRVLTAKNKKGGKASDQKEKASKSAL